MAAEDYLDFGFDHEYMFKHASTDFATRIRNERLVTKPKKTGKNKNIEWVTGQGEIIAVCDMEDSHLGNTIRYITRKIEEHNKAVDLMTKRGWTVPDYVINKRTGSEWLDILGKEANRRKAKAIIAAKKTLEAA